MAGNKPVVKLQRTKVNRSAASRSPTDSQTSEDNAQFPDLSILRKSIQTSITGFTQARDVFDTGTEELKQLLISECDVIYECKVCRNLFRSLANFISHKRVYCRQKFNTSLHAHFINNKFLKDDMLTILQNEQDYQQFVTNKDKCKPYNKDYSMKDDAFKHNKPKDLTAIIEKLSRKNDKPYNSDSKENDSKLDGKRERYLRMHQISGNNSAVYQNISNTNKYPERTIEQSPELLDPSEAVLGPDGKLLNYTTSKLNQVPVIQISDEEEEVCSPTSLVCKICKMKFSSQKTLKFHTKHKHADDRIVYPCPDCSDTFSNSWSVYRHLFKVHRKSAAHVRKLREAIQHKAYKLQKGVNKSKKDNSQETELMTDQQRMDQENQAWMDNFEGDCEIPRCGGCGRKFERRAALSSHRQTCQLRIAAHNKITSNMQRRMLAKSALEETEPDALLDSQPLNKMPKIDSKPIEKKIEIKIRRDYNKGTMLNPVNVETSPDANRAANRAATQSNSQTECASTSIGKDCFSIVNNYCDGTGDLKLLNFTNSSNMNPTKGFDDANFIVNSEGNSSKSPETDTLRDPLIEETVGEIKSGKIKTNNCANEDSNIDDGDLNLDDIRRICHVDKEKDEESCPNVIAAESDVSLQASTTDDDIIITSLSITDGESSKDQKVIEADNIKALDAQINNNATPLKLFCKSCHIKFDSVSKLRKHMARHFEWKRFKCKICDYKTYNKMQCISHIKYQHRIIGFVNHTKTLVQPLLASQACSETKSNTMENKTENMQTNECGEEVVFELSDDDFNDIENSIHSNKVNETIIPNTRDDVLESSNDCIVSGMKNDFGGNDKSSRITLQQKSIGDLPKLCNRPKRGRPKGSLKKKEINDYESNLCIKEKDIIIKDTLTSSLVQEKRIVMTFHKKQYVHDQPTTAKSYKKIINPKNKSMCNSQSSKSHPAHENECMITKNDAKEKDTKINNLIIDSPQIASSKSCSVSCKRPVRKRVKPLNKDFEYDLSNLLKLEAEAYKESHMPSALSSLKLQLKRKPFLQNEVLPVESPTESGGQRNPIPQTAAAPSKRCGAVLQARAIQAAREGRAQMREWRDHSQYTRGTLRQVPLTPTKIIITKASTVSSNQVQVLTKTAPIVKPDTVKVVRRQSTATMISEKSSLGSNRRKSVIPTLSPPKSITPTKKDSPPKRDSQTLQKKITAKQVNLEKNDRVIKKGVKRLSDASDEAVSPKKSKSKLSEENVTNKVKIRTSISEKSESIIPLSPEKTVESQKKSKSNDDTQNASTRRNKNSENVDSVKTFEVKSKRRISTANKKSNDITLKTESSHKIPGDNCSIIQSDNHKININTNKNLDNVNTIKKEILGYVLNERKDDDDSQSLNVGLNMKEEKEDIDNNEDHPVHRSSSADNAVDVESNASEQMISCKNNLAQETKINCNISEHIDDNKNDNARIDEIAMKDKIDSDIT